MTTATRLSFNVLDDRPGHRKVMSKPTKDGTPRYRWERVLHPNGRAHWSVKREVNAKDKFRVISAVRALVGAPQSPWDRARVTITLYVRVDGRRDDDANGYQVKGVLDGLVAAGVIVDDNTSVIGKPVIDVVVDKARAYSYAVEVEEVEG